MIRGAANASAVIRLAVESRRIRCGVLRIVYCFGRRRRSRHNPRPPATGLRRGRGGGWKPTNGRRGTPAQITMLIVVAELSAHIPGSLLPPPPTPAARSGRNLCRCAVRAIAPFRAHPSILFGKYCSIATWRKLIFRLFYELCAPCT